MRVLLAIFVGLFCLNTAFTDDSVAGREGQFLLLVEPKYKPGYCTIGTELRLIINFEGALEARLRQRVIGGCHIVIDPDLRSYVLEPINYSCGSISYRGRRVGPEGDEIFTMIDHRTRACEDIKKAKLITHEIRSNGGVSRLYSQD